MWKSAGANGWSQLPGTQTVSRIAADPQSGKLWIIELSDGKIFYGSGDGNWYQYGGGQAKEIAVFNNNPLITSTGDHLWMGVKGWGWFRMNTVR